MPDKRDMHQAKSHRSNKQKNQATPSKGRGPGSMTNGPAGASAGDTVPMNERMTKKNKSKR